MRNLTQEHIEEILIELSQAPDDESIIEVLKSHGLTLKEAVALDIVEVDE